MYEPKQVVSTESEIRQVLGEVVYSQGGKVIDHTNEHCRTWIERSTFVVVSTVDKSGRVDVAPKGHVGLSHPGLQPPLWLGREQASISSRYRFDPR